MTGDDQRPPPTATDLAGPLTERAIHEVSVVRSDLERLDHAGTGLLDRARVLEVLRDHYDRLRDELVDDETRAQLEPLPSVDETPGTGPLADWFRRAAQ